MHDVGWLLSSGSLFRGRDGALSTRALPSWLLTYPDLPSARPVQETQALRRVHGQDRSFFSVLRSMNQAVSERGFPSRRTLLTPESSRLSRVSECLSLIGPSGDSAVR